MQDTDSDDEWFLQSIKRYNELIMFDTGDPILQIQLCDKNTICALTVRGNKRAITVLSLPSKLTNPSQSYKMGGSSSDIKIKSGLFPISEPTKLLAIYENNCLLASHKEINGINVYSVNFNNSGKLVHETTIDLPVENPEVALLDEDKVIVAKHTSQPAYIYDLSADLTQETIISDKGNSSKLKPVCLSQYLIGLTVQCQGASYLFDCRKPESQIGYIPGDERSSFWMAYTSYAFHKSPETARNIYFLSKSGIFKFYDLRNLTSPVTNVKLPFSTSKDCLNIGFNPKNENILSISGFDDCVRLFNVNNMSELFTHDGHSRTELCTKETHVTDHLWYSDEYLISSALNNSINCWNPNVWAELNCS